jgi:hypothetical protein
MEVGGDSQSFDEKILIGRIETISSDRFATEALETLRFAAVN